MPHEAAALRDAEQVGAVEPADARIARRRVAETQERAGVAHGGEAEAYHGRTLGAVVAVVDLSRIVSALEVHMRWIRDDGCARAPGEPLASARNRRRDRPGVVADGQLGVGI